ncbi:MAG: sodium:proton antiporter [Calditrichaeota bacterium]|nr:sodium:proton antiporter [Calditrichota bacterium]RQW01763.1 MAG: sodium:proton antiporter [Calditrichota bacterium]
MIEPFLIGITAIIFLGILAQWISWRLKIPSILLLLIFGFLSGPVFNVVKPDFLFGNLFFPLVSFSVAVILFEGGMTLNISELKIVGNVVRNLITIGIIITWFTVTVASYFLLDLNLSLSLLFGAILVVTGPTVILPLLREIRPKGQLNSILKWEGILNDPIGAILAVLVFEAILETGIGAATAVTIQGILRTIILGSLIGLAGAYIIVLMLRYRLMPDFLRNPITLMMVFCVFAASNLIQAESGLFSVTLMGIVLASQKKVNVRHILEFKENLRVLLISVLFIILAARLTFDDLRMLGTSSVLFLAALILLIRPAAVMLSTLGSSLNFRERIFLAWMAPRGIVAAAVTSLFAYELTSKGIAGADLLVPVMFFVIIGTITIYGLGAKPLSRWLNIADPNPQGCLILGAHDCGRTIGKVLQEHGYSVIMVDTNWSNLSKARMQNLPTYYGSILSEHILDELNLDGIGRLLALTPNTEVNSLAALYFSKLFGSNEVYQLATEKSKKNGIQSVSKELRGHILFGENFSYSYLIDKFGKNSSIKTTPITDNYSFDDLKQQYGADNIIPLFLIDENDDLIIYTDVTRPAPKPGQILISLITEESISDKKNKEQ